MTSSRGSGQSVDRCDWEPEAALGHEDPFPPRWLNVRCVIRHGTFAETNGNGRDAPFAVNRTAAADIG